MSLNCSDPSTCARTIIPRADQIFQEVMVRRTNFPGILVPRAEIFAGPKFPWQTIFSRTTRTLPPSLTQTRSWRKYAQHLTPFLTWASLFYRPYTEPPLYLFSLCITFYMFRICILQPSLLLYMYVLHFPHWVMNKLWLWRANSHSCNQTRVDSGDSQ